jgi:hypothetical protein
MVLVVIVVFLISFLFAYIWKVRTLPNMQGLFNVILSSIAILQSIRFLYLLLTPFSKSVADVVPSLGYSFANGMGVIGVPEGLGKCLPLLGSNFDLLTIGLGPVAVIWLSVKQVLDTFSSAIPQPSPPKLPPPPAQSASQSSSGGP